MARHPTDAKPKHIWLKFLVNVISQYCHYCEGTREHGTLEELQVVSYIRTINIHLWVFAGRRENKAEP